MPSSRLAPAPTYFVYATQRGVPGRPHIKVYKSNGLR